MAGIDECNTIEWYHGTDLAETIHVYANVLLCQILLLEITIIVLCLL